MRQEVAKIDVRASNMGKTFSAIAIYVLANALLALPAAAQDQDTDWQTVVSESLSELETEDAPGIAVGVVMGGEIVAEHYLGLANLEHKVPISEKTRFNIASNAKQFTALMVLDLADQGLVDPKADFRDYLPDAMPEVDATITVENLITHTSGIRDIYDLWALTGVTWFERPFRNRDAMSMLKTQSDLNFAPGAEQQYSNSNYILLAELIAEVSDQKFHEYAGGFFATRGMDHTMVQRRYGVIVPDLARAYGYWSGWMENPAIANLHGDGFLYTTLRDQLVWEQQVQGAGATLSEDVIAASQKPVSTDLTARYGYGLEFGKYKSLDYVYHAGSTGSYNAFLMRFPSENVSVVAMGNTSEIGVAQTARRVADLVLGEAIGEPSYPTAPDTLGTMPEEDSLIGRYETDFGGLVVIERKDDALYASILGNEASKLIPGEGNLMGYEKLDNVKIAFAKTAGGMPELTVYTGVRDPIEAAYIAEPSLDASYLKGLEGAFVNAETETDILIEHVEGAAFKITKNGRTRDAELLSEDYFQMNSYRITALRGTDGKVSGLSVDNNRIRNVRFEPAAP